MRPAFPRGDLNTRITVSEYPIALYNLLIDMEKTGPSVAIGGAAAYAAIVTTSSLPRSEPMAHFKTGSAGQDSPHHFGGWSVSGRRLCRSSAMCTLACLAPLVTATAVHAQSTAASVVEISCGAKKGVGVAVQPDFDEGTHIVTTLHLVAGQPTCNIKNSRRQTTGAAITRVYYPADLALMKPHWSESFGSGALVPLDVGRLSSETATYFRFLNSGQVQTKPVGMDMASVNTPLKNLHQKLILNPASLTAFQNNLCQQPQLYPALDATIFKLRNPVRPGDSGSPIVQDNKIVGLIDGGYTVGIAPVYWSIDTVHFDSLYQSSGPIPPAGTTCANSAKQLYSADIPDIPTIGDVDLEPLYSTNFGELYAEMDAEDRQGVAEMAAELGLSLQELAPNVIDVYQDEATGAIIALPRGFTITPEQDKELTATYIEVMNPSEDLIMVVFVENDYDAYDDPQDFGDRGFIEHLAEQSGSSWFENVQEAECYPEELYCERTFETSFEVAELDEYGNPVMGMGTAMLTTDDHDLLAMAIAVRSDARQRAAADFIVMAMCLDLADFAYY